MSLESALARLEARLKEDPRGREFPFTSRVVAWMKRLQPSSSAVLLLAAWGHVLDRWKLPRESFPKTTAGYHKWRRALDALAADATSQILREEGVGEETAVRVRDLILKKNFPADPEAQTLEDADCLAFLEMKLEGYLNDWDETKTVRILKGTLEKMTPLARTLAAEIPLSERARLLLKKALSD